MDGRKKKTTGDEEEVEQLLRAAQDELLLKLSVDSHMSRVSPDYLDSDLDSRFEALRSRPSRSKSKSRSKSTSQAVSSKPKPQQEQQQQQQSEDDLFARFSALKASLPSSSTVGVPPGSDGIGDDNEDEVDKVIRWAIDAARLDPSLPSDDDNCESNDDDYDKHSTDDDEDGEDTDDDGKLKKKKKKNAQRK
ncbi:transcription initiation factor TFIID subunit 11 isoform X3 [Tripterygium wilfordii]|uniref:Transcription initiation factor TFIID subunit 11 isoform X3 n=1 Tax=Tripterygium wilfordii TaxID=458696 RepID=A0A7J7CV92_TRIWF|nr:putative uncharacterized protein DDB_G0270496 [Tripterygium wilfordii]KAF5737954.1 transcription initiation factor TFIID subunit 11 isoform X3 [Tripterygium wilfordii]